MKPALSTISIAPVEPAASHATAAGVVSRGCRIGPHSTIGGSIDVAGWGAGGCNV